MAVLSGQQILAERFHCLAICAGNSFVLTESTDAAQQRGIQLFLAKVQDICFFSKGGGGVVDITSYIFAKFYSITNNFGNFFKISILLANSVISAA